jgi:hypothetical protein
MTPRLARAVTFLVLIAAMVGTAVADRMPSRRPPPQQQQQQQQQVAPRANPTPVRHDTKFHAVPDSTLQLRAVVYDGSTNGSLTVQVTNPSKAVQKFSAKGLYFVPEGDPNTAPQRLGAVGPMQMATDKKEVSELEIAPGATVDVVLDVFCIDSHRSSPSPQNKFNVGAKRLPRELASTIENRAQSKVDEQRAANAPAPRPAAKGAIQGEVWRSRDAKWVELDGEGKQEATKKR